MLFAKSGGLFFYASWLSEASKKYMRNWLPICEKIQLRLKKHLYVSNLSTLS